MDAVLLPEPTTAHSSICPPHCRRYPTFTSDIYLLITGADITGIQAFK
jgi:hypothetical protein